MIIGLAAVGDCLSRRNEECIAQQKRITATIPKRRARRRDKKGPAVWPSWWASRPRPPNSNRIGTDGSLRSPFVGDSAGHSRSCDEYVSRHPGPCSPGVSAGQAAIREIWPSDSSAPERVAGGLRGLRLGDRSPHAATRPELLCFLRKAGLLQQHRKLALCAAQLSAWPPARRFSQRA
jgi:hypothetical protein